MSNSATPPAFKRNIYLKYSSSVKNKASLLFFQLRVFFFMSIIQSASWPVFLYYQCFFLFILAKCYLQLSLDFSISPLICVHTVLQISSFRMRFLQVKFYIVLINLIPASFSLLLSLSLVIPDSLLYISAYTVIAI